MLFMSMPTDSGMYGAETVPRTMPQSFGMVGVVKEGVLDFCHTHWNGWLAVKIPYYGINDVVCFGNHLAQIFSDNAMHNLWMCQ